MKKNPMLILLALVWLTVGIGCKKDTATPKTEQNLCNVGNPVSDLPWLKEIIEGIKNDNCFNEVVQYDYEGVNVYYVGSNPVVCSEPTFVIYKCSGDTLCGTTSALTGKDNCPADLYSKLSNKKIIYKKP